MKPASKQLANGEFDSPDEELEELRLSFRERLLSELSRLETLRDLLAGATGASTQLYADIGEFAHRLRGAALIFEFRQIGEAAKSLEVAVIESAVVASKARRRHLIRLSILALAEQISQVVSS